MVQGGAAAIAVEQLWAARAPEGAVDDLEEDASQAYSSEQPPQSIPASGSIASTWRFMPARGEEEDGTAPADATLLDQLSSEDLARVSVHPWRVCFTSSVPDQRFTLLALELAFRSGQARHRLMQTRIAVCVYLALQLGLAWWYAAWWLATVYGESSPSGIAASRLVTAICIRMCGSVGILLVMLWCTFQPWYGTSRGLRRMRWLVHALAVTSALHGVLMCDVLQLEPLEYGVFVLNFMPQCSAWRAVVLVASQAVFCTAWLVFAGCSIPRVFPVPDYPVPALLNIVYGGNCIGVLIAVAVVRIVVEYRSRVALLADVSAERRMREVRNEESRCKRLLTSTLPPQVLFRMMHDSGPVAEACPCTAVCVKIYAAPSTAGPSLEHRLGRVAAQLHELIEEEAFSAGVFKNSSDAWTVVLLVGALAPMPMPACNEEAACFALQLRDRVRRLQPHLKDVRCSCSIAVAYGMATACVALGGSARFAVVGAPVDAAVALVESVPPDQVWLQNDSLFDPNSTAMRRLALSLTNARANVTVLPALSGADGTPASTRARRVSLQPVGGPAIPAMPPSRRAALVDLGSECSASVTTDLWTDSSSQSSGASPPFLRADSVNTSSLQQALLLANQRAEGADLSAAQNAALALYQSPDSDHGDAESTLDAVVRMQPPVSPFEIALAAASCWAPQQRHPQADAQQPLLSQQPESSARTWFSAAAAGRPSPGDGVSSWKTAYQALVQRRATLSRTWTAFAFALLLVYELGVAAPTDLFLSGSEFCYAFAWPPAPMWSLWIPISGIRLGVVAPLALATSLLYACRAGVRSEYALACTLLVFVAQLGVQYVGDDQSVAMPHFFVILVLNLDPVPLRQRLWCALAMSCLWSLALCLLSMFENASNPWPLSIGCLLHTLLFFPAEIIPAVDRERLALAQALHEAYMRDVEGILAARQARFTALLHQVACPPHLRTSAAPETFAVATLSFVLTEPAMGRTLHAALALTLVEHIVDSMMKHPVVILRTTRPQQLTVAVRVQSGAAREAALSMVTTTCQRIAELPDGVRVRVALDRPAHLVTGLLLLLGSMRPSLVIVHAT